MGMTALSIAGAAGLGLAGGALSGYAAKESAQANAQASAINSAAQAANLRMQGATIAANKNVEAVNYDAQAEYYMREAGNAQLQGRDERTLRSLTLGQQTGSINAQAAGSGIEVNSRVVQKTIGDTTKSAMNDMMMSARNEYEKAYGAVKNSRIAEVNAKNARSIGSWAQSAYEKLASDTETYGALTADAMVDSGYTSMWTSTVAGGLSGLGMGIGKFGG